MVKMRKDRRDLIKAIGMGGAALLVGAWVPDVFSKEIYPNEKITWIIANKPGGGIDSMARAVSPYVTKYLREGSPGAKGGYVVIKNEPGASYHKGYNMIYNAKPDGYTIGAMDMSFATETLISKLEFDLDRFTYLLRVMTTQRLLVTNKNGFQSWQEMLKSAKTKELRWGVGGFGRALHIDSIIVKEAVGIPARFIPLGGTPECMSALLRGDIQVALVSEDSVKALIDAKEIKALAEFSEESDSIGVPSIKELGYGDLASKVGEHRYVIGPPALPKAIRNTLIGAYKKAFGDKEFLAWTKKAGAVLSPLYGNEAESETRRIFKFYLDDLKPLLIKYLS